MAPPKRAFPVKPIVLNLSKAIFLKIGDFAGIGCWLLVAGCQLPVPVPGSRLPVLGCLFPVAGSRLQVGTTLVKIKPPLLLHCGTVGLFRLQLEPAVYGYLSNRLHAGYGYQLPFNGSNFNNPAIMMQSQSIMMKRLGPGSLSS